MPPPHTSGGGSLVPERQDMDLTIDISDAEWMSANDRTHWAVKAKRTKALRVKTRLLARRLNPARGPVHVTAFIAYPRAGKADPGNAAPTVKAILDGLTDARYWPDDDHHHVIGPDYRRDPDTRTKGLHRVRLVLTPQDHEF